MNIILQIFLCPNILSYIQFYCILILYTILFYRSEGHNSQLKKSLPRAANIWAIIGHIRKEEAMVHAKLYNAAIGFSPETSKKRSKETEKHQKELQNIVSNYRNVSIDQYISYIVKFYNMKLDGNN